MNKRGVGIHKKEGERQRDMIRVECKYEGKHDKSNVFFFHFNLVFFYSRRCFFLNPLLQPLSFSPQHDDDEDSNEDDVAMFHDDISSPRNAIIFN